MCKADAAFIFIPEKDAQIRTAPQRRWRAAATMRASLGDVLGRWDAFFLNGGNLAVQTQAYLVATKEIPSLL